MNPYALKILTNIGFILTQGFLILEIERCWLILKGKKNKTASKVIAFIEMPLSAYIKNEQKLRITSVIITPVIFGIFSICAIPFLNGFMGTHINLGYPWGYIAMFGIGYMGINILLIISMIHVYISRKNTSLNQASYLLLLYIILIMGLFYLQYITIKT
jgi:hypothetical protein